MDDDDLGGASKPQQVHLVVAGSRLQAQSSSRHLESDGSIRTKIIQTEQDLRGHGGAYTILHLCGSWWENPVVQTQEFRIVANRCMVMFG
jgi:hypothetical protein